MVVADDPRQDAAVRDLVVALVRQGVTSTLSRHDGHRYGVLHIDSNLPDVRLAIGGPDENHFVATVLADGRYRAEFDRQMADKGWARVWVPESDDAHERLEPIPDLRGARELPVLIVAGADHDAMVKAIVAVTIDLDDAVIEVDQPADLDAATGTVEDYTVAVLNRGLPGFNVEADGSMYLSIMRSCSGWPSGVWIDPPRRATPDGANFQFEHWSHRFEYAVASGTGDWRDAGIVRAGHDYNNPLVARVLDPHAGSLPPTTSFLEVEPASAVVTVLKPAGTAASRMAGMDVDPAQGVALRLYESSGRPTQVSIRSRWPIAEAGAANVLEEDARPLSPSGASVDLRLEPYEIATIAATLQVTGGEHGESLELAGRGEPAQPVFSDYWLHNKGAAPMGYQAVTVQIRPSFLTGDGPFMVPIVVASERTDEAVAGSVAVVVPPGWEATPSERIYRLAPGAHLAFEATVRPAAGAPAGRYFVAARIEDGADQRHEDVVTVDLRPGGDGTTARRLGDQRSAALAWAVERAHATSGIEPADPSSPNAGARHDPGGELVVRLMSDEISVAPGVSGVLRVSMRNLAASEIRGEAQILSPLETWSTITPLDPGFLRRTGRRDGRRLRRQATGRRRRRDVLGAGEGHVFRATPVFGIRSVHDRRTEERGGARPRRQAVARRPGSRVSGGSDDGPDQGRLAALGSTNRLALAPACRSAGRRARLRLTVDLGPPLSDPRRLARPDLRGIPDPRGLGRCDVACHARPDGRGEHVPQPGPHGEDGHDARPHERRTGDPRDRRRLVRARTRSVRARVRERVRRPARLAG